MCSLGYRVKYRHTLVHFLIETTFIFRCKRTHGLFFQVRKHYMEYLIKLLSVNYENNQKLLNKNIYLPSAIWRCAKNIEMKAAQMCMMAQLYRKHIVAEVQYCRSSQLVIFIIIASSRSRIFSGRGIRARRVP